MSIYIVFFFLGPCASNVVFMIVLSSVSGYENHWLEILFQVHHIGLKSTGKLPPQTGQGKYDHEADEHKLKATDTTHKTFSMFSECKQQKSQRDNNKYHNVTGLKRPLDIRIVALLAYAAHPYSGPYTNKYHNETQERSYY